MYTRCYFLMGTPSQRLMLKRYKGKRGGIRLFYKYRPRRGLIQRLAFELNSSETAIREEIKNERLYLLRSLYGSEVRISEI